MGGTVALCHSEPSVASELLATQGTWSGGAQVRTAMGKQKHQEPQQKITPRRKCERMTLVEMRCANQITGLGVPVKPFSFISASGAGPIP